MRADKTGVVFYLEASAEEIFKRIKDDKTRPLLKVDNPEIKLQSLLSERQNLYKKADCVVNTDNMPIEKVAKQVLEYYQNPVDLKQ